MRRFILKKTAINDLLVIERNPLRDNRGYFERLFCDTELEEILENRKIAQINHSRTKQKGTVRGMHYQLPPFSEMKIVSCLRGKVFDVAIDLRKGSKTFLHWHSELLSETNHRSIVIPEGFAHGFQTLTKECELIYLHTATYKPEDQAGLNALDPLLAIDWPLSITECSPRDQSHSMLSSNFLGISL